MIETLAKSTEFLSNEELISRHLSLRDQYHLPDPSVISSDEIYVHPKILKTYNDKLAVIAKENGFPLVDCEESRKFFQRHPNIGVFYPNSFNYILINRKIIGKNIGQDRIYDRKLFSIDLTTEVARALISQSSPQIDPQELSEKSALSICSPTILNSPFLLGGYSGFLFYSQKTFNLHQQIPTINS